MNKGMLLLKLLSLQSCLPRISIFCRELQDSLFLLGPCHCNWRRDVWHECLASDFLPHHWEKLQMQRAGPCSMAYCWEWDNWSKRIHLSPLVSYLYLFGSRSCLAAMSLKCGECLVFRIFYFIWETKEGSLWKCSCQVNDSNRATKLLKA